MDEFSRLGRTRRPAPRSRHERPPDALSSGSDGGTSCLFRLRPRGTCPVPGTVGGTVGRAAVYVSVYSGPEPPSGGVRRPPLAVIAPHWTQLDGVTPTR